MIEMAFLSSCSPSDPVGTPPIKICPSGSASRKMAVISDDLPAPVLPTIPTWFMEITLPGVVLALLNLTCYLKSGLVLKNPLLSSKGLRAPFHNLFAFPNE